VALNHIEYKHQLILVLVLLLGLYHFFLILQIEEQQHPLRMVLNHLFVLIQQL
jgi:hypothetical protein